MAQIDPRTAEFAILQVLSTESKSHKFNMIGRPYQIGPMEQTLGLRFTNEDREIADQAFESLRAKSGAASLEKTERVVTMAKVSEFDPSAFLDDEQTIAEYLTAALEDDDFDVFLSAVGHVAKARGMSAIAESTGLGRESLYKAMTPGAKPRYDTVLKVLQSLGVKVTISPSSMNKPSNVLQSDA